MKSLKYILGAALLALFVHGASAQVTWTDSSPFDVTNTYATYIPKTAMPGLRNSLAGIKTLTDAATITANIDDAQVFAVTIGATGRTFAISAHKPGRRIWLLVKQDGTGSRTITTWTGITWSGGTAPTLTTAANKTDLFEFLDTGSTFLGATVALNY